MTVEIIPIEGLPEVAPGDDLAELLAPALVAAGVADGDIVVVTSKVVSKAEDRLVPGDDRTAAVVAETVRVVARRGDLVIAETRHGFICANAGVDASNLEDGVLALLPEDPDRSAEVLRATLCRALGLTRLGVVITDTFGRAWRTGLVNVAIGCAGLPALVDLRGRADHNGRALEVTVVAYADEIAASSGLVMAKDARIPVAIVRGLRAPDAPNGPATDLIRPPEEDLFRMSPLEALRSSGSSAPFARGDVPRTSIEEAIAVAVADAARSADLRFTVVSSADGVRALTGPLEAPAETAALIAVTSERSEGGPEAAVVGERLRLALEAHGLGVVRRSVPDDDIDVRDRLGVGGGRRVVYLLACGRVDGGRAVEPGPRVDPSELTSWS